MRIYRMTATFGKLEQRTLTLEPGLNIIEAENEWGKSTWCAFLMAMLYGLDTRAKSTKTTLADKERYVPWSGSPMSGRMDICWRGRDITLERNTRGRIPMGEFRAYETASGVAVPELTAANCGQTLLGVEQSVLRRAGFIRLQDLPVTQDEALRRRLNALVSTGDESGDGERLERGLRELKNKCRYNRTGLLPQAETERDALMETLRERKELEAQTEKRKLRLAEVTRWLRQLQNHEHALLHAAARMDAQRIAQAKADWEAAEEVLRKKEQLCGKLPSQEIAQAKLHQLKEFQEQWHGACMEAELLPEEPEKPEPPEAFAGLDAQKARQQLMEDTARYTTLRGKKRGRAALLAAVLSMLLGIFLACWYDVMLAAVGAIPCLVFLGIALLQHRSRAGAMAALEKQYGSGDPELWRVLLERYEREMAAYRRELENCHAARGDVDARLTALQTKRQSLCAEQSPEKVLELWQLVLRRWEEFHLARREAQKAKIHYETMASMAKTVEAPEEADELTYTAAETARLISDARQEQQNLQNRIGQYQGRMEALGQREQLEQQLRQVQQRIGKLEEYYSAAELALHTLTAAKRELQRRFAPRISSRAQALMARMTGGRYAAVTLGESFDLLCAARTENTLREILWRSDGTVDQLYLALRLAVAEELTPGVPLVLDDALVRFDDTRLRAALDILEDMAKDRQVILFTCQSREKRIWKEKGEGR